MAVGVGDRFVRRHNAARGSTSNTTAGDITYDTFAINDGSEYSWTNPAVTPGVAGLYLCMFDIGYVNLASTRAVGTLVPRLNGTTDQTRFRASGRYLRNSGGAQEGASFGVAILDLSASDTVRIRNPGSLSPTDAVGNYATDAGTGGAIQMLKLPDNNFTHVERTSDAAEVGTSNINTTRPWLDTSGTWTTVTFNSEVSDDDSLYSGSGGDITLKANKKYMIVWGVTAYSTDASRHTYVTRLRINGTNRQTSSGYQRNTASQGPPMQGIYLHEVGGSNETLNIQVTHEIEGGDAGTPQVADAYVQVLELNDGTEWIHVDNGATDSMTTALASGTNTNMPLSSTYRADGDSNLSLDGTNDGVQNDSGGTLPVLAIAWNRWDRDSGSSGTRKSPIGTFRVNGSQLGYGINSAYSRGQQSSDDTFQASFVGAVLADVNNGSDVEYRVRDSSSTSNADMGIYASTHRHFLGMQVLNLDTLDAAGSTTSVGTAFAKAPSFGAGDLAWRETESFEGVTDGTNVTSSNTLFDLVYTTGNVVGDDGDIHTALDGTDYALLNATSQTAAVERQMGSQSDAKIRLGFYNEESTPNVGFLWGGGDGNITDIEVRLNANRTLTLRTNFIARDTSTATIPADGWFSIDIIFDGSSVDVEIYTASAKGSTIAETLTTSTSVPATIDRWAAGSKSSVTISNRGLDWYEGVYGNLALTTRVSSTTSVGTLFTKAPTFNTGTVSAGSVTLAGSALIRGPTFPTGNLDPGSVTSVGTLFTRAPTFPTGTVTAGASTTTGTLLTSAPTFPTGNFSPGSVTVFDGNAVPYAPPVGRYAGTLVAGSVTSVGTLYAQAPTFPTGTATGGETTSVGTLFERAGTFPAGNLSSGSTTSVGTLFQRAPTFPGGNLDAGSVTSVGTLFTKAPAFPTGNVSGGSELVGVLFQKAGTFPAGTMDPGSVTVAGAGGTDTYEPGASGDDGYIWDNNNDYSSPTNINTGLGYFYTGRQSISKYGTFLRFPNVIVDKGATIESAKITFVSEGTSDFSGGTSNNTIYGIDEDDHTAPTTTGAWSTDHGLHTTASAGWDISSWPSAGATVDTPDIASIIEEIVGRSGWVSGNDIGIHIDNDNNTGDLRYVRSASFDHATYDPPQLEITVAGGLTSTNVFPVGTAAPQPVTSTGTLFSRAPTFPSGTVAGGEATSVGTLFTKAPTFPAGSVSGGNEVIGVLFAKAPTFPTGTADPGDVTLVGTTFTSAPDFQSAKIQLVNALSGDTGANVTSFDVAIPSWGQQNGDVWTIYLAKDDDGSALNLDAEFTAFFNVVSTASRDSRHRGGYRVHDGTETGPWTFTQDLEWTVYVLALWRNVDNDDPLDSITRDASAFANQSGSISHGASLPAPNTADPVLIHFIGQNDSTSGVLAGPPTGMTKVEEEDTATSISVPSISVAYEQLTGSSAPGSRTWANRTRSGDGALIAHYLKPATGGGGTVTGTQTSVGTTFSKAPSFPGGNLDAGDVTAAGTLFSKAPTFPSGVASESQYLQGTTYQQSPTFPTGSVLPDVTSVGTTFAKAPSFPTGDLDAGSVTSIGTTYVPGVSFPTGVVESGGVLVGSLFQRAVTFPTGAVTIGATTLTGTLYQQAPTFPTGVLESIGYAVGSLFQRAGTFPTGTVAIGPAYSAGTTFVSDPVFPTGILGFPVTLEGSTFITTGTFPEGGRLFDEPREGTVRNLDDVTWLETRVAGSGGHRNRGKPRIRRSRFGA